MSCSARSPSGTDILCSLYYSINFSLQGKYYILVSTESLLNLLVSEFYGSEAAALKVSVQEVLLCLMLLTVCFLWVAMFVFLHRSKLQDGVTQSS